MSNDYNWLQWGLLILIVLASLALMINASPQSDSMLLAMVLVAFIYLWSKELIGRWWALLPAFLFAFSPTVLAYGNNAVSGIAAALGIFIAFYFFIKFLLSSTRKHLLWAGLAFGISQIINFSTIILTPFFIILTIIFIATSLTKIKANQFIKRAFKYIYWLLIIFIIGYALVYFVYFLSDFEYPLSYKKLLVFENSPQWKYPLNIFLIKEPLPSLILIDLVLLLSVWNVLKKLKSYNLCLKSFTDYLGTHFPEFSMLIFTALYLPYLAVKNPADAGIQHLLPVMPFIYILSAGALKKWINKKTTAETGIIWKQALNIVINFIKKSFKSVFIAILLIWYLAEVLFATPYYAAYLNQFGL